MSRIVIVQPVCLFINNYHSNTSARRVCEPIATSKYPVKKTGPARNEQGKLRPIRTADKCYVYDSFLHPSLLVCSMIFFMKVGDVRIA